MSSASRVHLSVLQGSQVLTVWTESPPVAVQAAGWVGRILPAWCTLSGRVLLADPDVAELARRVAAAARVGYAVADEESEPGLVAAAAPVRAYHGRVVAAISVSGPKFRLGARLAEAGLRARQAAEQLSAVIGGSAGAAGRN